MKKMLRFSALFLCFCLLCLPVCLAFDVVEPNASFYVADYADALLPETENYIITHNNSLAGQCGAQIVVVTIDFLDGAEIEDYSTKLFNQWKIGDPEKNNGLLVLLVIGEQKYWATQGSGISNSLTSALLSEYLYDYLESDFAAAQYDVGVRKLFDALAGWYEKQYSIEVKAVESTVSAPEGMETLDSALQNTDDFTEHETIPDDRQPFTKGGLIGKVAGWILIAIAAAAVLSALVIIIPRAYSLRKQGYNYSVFNRAFWSKRHRSPPARPAASSNRPHAAAPAQPSAPQAQSPRSSSGGFGSGHGISGLNRTSSPGSSLSSRPVSAPRRPSSTSRPASNNGSGGAGKNSR